MQCQPRWFAPALLPLATGLIWLLAGWHAGIVIGIVACLPGLGLIAGAGAQLLWPGGHHANYFMALGSVLAVLLAILCSLWLGLIATAALVVMGIGSFLVAGYAAFFQMVWPPQVPNATASVGLARKVAADEALLATFITGAHIPRGGAVLRDRRELDQLEHVFQSRGWDHNPERLHATPDAPRDWQMRPRRAAGHDFEWLTFDSGYAPDPELPGVERWLAHRSNRRMTARVLQHPGGPRPWLLCIHGYRMGLPWIDFPLFDLERFHHRLGLNVIMPILPLHGTRSVSRITGGLYLDGPMADILHAQSQALWDLRRCCAWIRTQQPDMDIGVLGYSLGGYNAALLAAFEPDLASVVAGIPLADIPAALWHHLPDVHLRYIQAQGIDPAYLRCLLAPVSPLQLAPNGALDRRYIFAATADQMVPAEQPLQLWEHWGQPSIHWYHGSHLSVRHEPAVGPFVENALRETGLAGSTGVDSERAGHMS